MFVSFTTGRDGRAVTWDEVAARLVPLLRTPNLFLSLTKLPREKWPLSRPFAPFLIECVGVDSEHGIAYAGADQAARWGVTPDEVFARATANARSAFTDDVASYDPQAPYPIWHVSRNDSYESSRLLVPGWLASFAGKVKGRPVAIVPERSTLIVGGDKDQRCLTRLVQSAKAEFDASPRSISPALYTVDENGTTIPLVVEPEHPHAADVAMGHVMLASLEYDAQQKAHQENLGEEVFVASFKAMKSDTGAVFGVTTWTQTVPSSLPEADEVSLVLVAGGKAAQVIRVPWKPFLEIAHEHLEPEEGLAPPRWRTTGWPDARTMERLRSAAISVTVV